MSEHSPAKDISPDIIKLFSPDGVLADKITGFQPRDAQLQMADAVYEALAKRSQVIVEAGTGTGKTFAYLVPAIKSQRKTIISTGTKNLQEQLFLRDLPLIKEALKSNKQTALLKGRANYLCTYRLLQHSRGTHLMDSETLSDLTKVKKWSVATETGDIGEVTNIKEDSKVLPFVTSTVDNCLGRDCPDYEECYLVKARKKAMEADLVVVNHHLFFADLALKDTGFGELVPEVEAIIFDEAHQIPDIATEYFGETLSGRQVYDMCRDIEAIQKTVLKDAAQLAQAAEKLRVTIADLRLMYPILPQKGNWFEQLRREEVQEQMQRLSDAFDLLYEVSKLHLGREKAMDALFERLAEARSRLGKMLDSQQLGVSLWYETTPKHIILHATPLSIAKRFGAILDNSDSAWVFTSATLAVDDNFNHYTRLLGLSPENEMILDSPFDYQTQSLLCIPRYLPDAQQYNRADSLVEIAIKVVEASRGGCFLLFTSHAMMHKVAKILADEIDNPILVQGETSKRELLNKFVEQQEAVLLGTGAFWEGVDVRGDKLTCVLIDKLPFTSPDEPLLQAKVEDCRKKGQNPFATMQIPQAVITLKQGAGRLIRDVNDKGVLIICDHRLVNKDYGQVFLRSLPDMQRTRSLTKALDFLSSL